MCVVRVKVPESTGRRIENHPQVTWSIADSHKINILSVNRRINSQSMLNARGSKEAMMQMSWSFTFEKFNFKMSLTVDPHNENLRIYSQAR